MKRLAFLVLAACPPKPVGPVTPPPEPPLTGGVGCPSAANVYVASYVQPAEGDKGGHTGWVLPLFDKQGAGTPGVDYQPLDAAAAAAAGIPAPPPSVWLLVPGGAPCKATIGNYYAANVEGQPPNVAYGVELGGCAAPQTADGEAIVLASDQPPNQCHIEPPHPIATRLGEVNAQKQWTAPTKQTAIPPALVPAIPAHDCAAPSCEMLWSIVQVDVANQPVAWGGTVNWIHPGTTPQCTWETETFSGFFAMGDHGKPAKISEGQDHPLILTGVLSDQTGAKVLLAEGAGEYTTYDLAGGKTTVGRHLVWLMAPAEAYVVDDHIGPECPHGSP